MPLYNVPCQDGSDPECWGTREESHPLEGLSLAQVKQIAEDNEVTLTLKDVQTNSLELTSDEKELLAQYGSFDRPTDFRLVVCGACGS